MNRFWIAVAALLIVNVTISESVNAADALKGVEIKKGKDSQRRLGLPGAVEYSWVVPFKNKNYTFLISLDDQLYNTARNDKDRVRESDLTVIPSMVQEGTEALQDLSREFKRFTSTWSKESQVNFVLAFVHSILYVRDKKIGFIEYYKSAVEILGDEEGDCEDSSILFASILNGLGFELALIVFPGSAIVPGLVAIGVKGNFWGDVFRFPGGIDKYYYCETTSDVDTDYRWKLGELPPSLEDRESYMMPIHPNPAPPKPVTQAPQAPASETPFAPANA